MLTLLLSELDERGYHLVPRMGWRKRPHIPRGHGWLTLFVDPALTRSDYRWRNRKDCQLLSAVQPPSTTKVWPFTKPLFRSSARNRMASAMSVVDANLAIGTRLMMSSSV